MRPKRGFSLSGEIELASTGPSSLARVEVSSLLRLRPSFMPLFTNHREEVFPEVRTQDAERWHYTMVGIGQTLRYHILKVGKQAAGEGSVTYDKRRKRWRARIPVERSEGTRRIHLGWFKTRDEAHIALVDTLSRGGRLRVSEERLKAKTWDYPRLVFPTF